MSHELMSIGDFARRAGVAASALRFYEAQGLIPPAVRSGGGRRLYPRAALRRVAFVRAAQAIGLSLAEIQAELARLPDGRTPTADDWARLSSAWQRVVDERIAALTRLRDTLASCIGCGCLSMERCGLYNPQDLAGQRGPGARYWMGDRPGEARAAVEPGPATGRDAGPASD